MPWRRAWQPTPVFLPREFHGHSQVAQWVKKPLASAGDIEDTGLIPGWGRSSEGGNGNLL